MECNRTQVENGAPICARWCSATRRSRTTARRSRIVAQTEEAVADVLRRATEDDDRAGTLAHVVSAITFLAMGASVNSGSSVEEILAEIRHQVAALVSEQSRR